MVWVLKVSIDGADHLPSGGPPLVDHLFFYIFIYIKKKYNKTSKTITHFAPWFNLSAYSLQTPCNLFTNITIS